MKFENLVSGKTHVTGAALALALALFNLASPSSPAQSYVVVDLTATAANAIAKSVDGSLAGGSVAPSPASALIRATLWDADGSTDLHPAFLDNPATGAVGRSSIEGVAGNLQVGWGAGVPTSNRSVALAWRGTADSATTLSVPFADAGAQALATDGTQIVGYATAINPEDNTVGLMHALLWDAATGTAIDLGDGGKGARAYGVGGGQQVGYVTKASAAAALWRGDSRTLVVLHPKNAVASVANATDGSRQVGYASYDVRVRAEAAKGNKDARFSYATVWSGTAASALNIHPYAINNPNVAFNNSYALGVSTTRIAGYATDPSKTGSPAYQHAIVWDELYQATDLNAFLPAGFVGSIAYSVAEDGTVAGVISTADGRRHAALWIPVADAP